MDLIVFLPLARLIYESLTGQSKNEFNRILLTLARLKTFSGATGVVAVVNDTKNGRTNIHYNDHRYFEILLTKDSFGKLVVGDIKCIMKNKD